MSRNFYARKNLVSNIANLISSIIVGVYYTPYLLQTLGPMAYGIVPLALTFNQYVNVLTSSLTGSLSRFYTIALQNKQYKEASHYISTSFCVLGAIIIPLIPLLFIFILNIGQILNIPTAYIPSAKILFTFTISGLFLSLFSSVLNISLFAQNRLDLLNVTRITRTTLRLVFVVLFFSFEFGDTRIEYVGYANFLTEVAVLVISLVFFKSHTHKDISIRLSLFDKTILATVLTMTFWNILHQLGDTGLYRIDSFLVSYFWNTGVSGILSALSEIGVYIMVVTSVISGLFAPIIMIAYSNKEHSNVQSLTLNSSLITGVLTAIITGILIGYSQTIIKLWLGGEYVEHFDWYIIKLIPIPFYIASGIFAFVFRAWNKVLVPALITILIGGINFFIAYWVYSHFFNNKDLISYVISITAILIILQSYFLNALIFCSIYKGNTKSIFLIFFKISITLTLCSICSYVFNHFCKTETIYSLFISTFICFMIFALTSFYLILNKAAREEFKCIFLK